MVAAVSWRPESNGTDRRAVCGPNGWLIRERNRLVLVEHRNRGEAPVRMQIPLRSCVAVTLADEPGLPGQGFVRFALTARFGTGASFTVTLWFPHQQRDVLARIAEEINDLRAVPPTGNAAPEPRPLPLLDVRLAPDDEDWVAFRPGPCSDGVLRSEWGESS